MKAKGEKTENSESRGTSRSTTHTVETTADDRGMAAVPFEEVKRRLADFIATYYRPPGRP